MAETEEARKTYRGNCHCGAFIVEARLPKLSVVSCCNCSICSKKGYLWVFPGEDWSVVKGNDILKDYTFANGTYHHKFCPTCGIGVMAQNSAFPPGHQVGINARIFQDLDIWDLEQKTFDGEKLQPKYEAPVYTGAEPSAEIEGAKIYTGGCHCGAIKVAVKTKPLDETYEGAKECNCSICQRGGFIWIYPLENQIAVEGEDNFSYYTFGGSAAASVRKAFCRTCGVQVLNDFNPDLTSEQIAELPETMQQFAAMNPKIKPVNVRMLNDVDISKLKTTRVNDKEREPVYANP